MMDKVSIAAFDNFFSTVFCLDKRFDNLSEVLNDHLFDMQTRLIPLFE